MTRTRNYDYDAASKRHMLDAELLESERRRANASQLYGYAAECYLSGIAVKTDLATLGVDGLEGDLRFHVHEMWPKLIIALRGRGHSRLLDALGEANPFREWHHQDRYTDKGCDDTALLEKQRKGAERAREAFTRVRLGTL